METGHCVFVGDACGSRRGIFVGVMKGSVGEVRTLKLVTPLPSSVSPVPERVLYLPPGFPLRVLKKKKKDLLRPALHHRASKRSVPPQGYPRS